MYIRNGLSLCMYIDYTQAHTHVTKTSIYLENKHKNYISRYFLNIQNFIILFLFLIKTATNCINWNTNMCAEFKQYYISYFFLLHFMIIKRIKFIQNKKTLHIIPRYHQQ